jgi:hypothetical protein
MDPIEILQAEWSKSARFRAMHRVLTITEDGLVLGFGTMLAKMDRSAEPKIGLVLDEPAEERLLALLAAAYGRPVERRVLGNIHRASQYRCDGQESLASIELALTGLPPLTDEYKASYRLYLADQLIAGGVAPREVTKALGIDPAPRDGSKAGFNPAELRVPPGNGRDSGDWSDGSGASGIPVAARNPPAAPEYRTGDPDEFFDTLYPQVHALARRLGINETWMLGLAAHESGWLDPHNRDLNDPFGVTHRGGPNFAYGSIGDAIAYWEKKYGPVVRGATSPADFAQRLRAAHYNVLDPHWSEKVINNIRSVSRRLPGWLSRRSGP